MHVNCYPGSDNIPDWNQLELASINTLPSRSYLIPFPDFRKCFDAVTDYRRYLSDYIYMLNGSWDYKHYSQAELIPEKFNLHNTDLLEIELPMPCANTTSDIPSHHPPYVSQHQGVHLYRRFCSLPHHWSSLRKRLAFTSVSFAFHVFINGKAAGYSDLRGEPVYFDITSLWHESENEIIILVYDNSCSNHLRSGWPRNINGLFCDIFVEALPAFSLFDMSIDTQCSVSDFSSWSLKINAEFVSCRISLEQPTVRFELYDNYKLLGQSEQLVALSPAKIERHSDNSVKTSGSIDVEIELEDIIPWSADRPKVYDLYVTISDNRFKEHVSYHQCVGFRTISRKGNKFIINGRPLRLVAASYQSFTSSLNKTSFRQINPAKKGAFSIAGKIGNDLMAMRESGYNCLFLIDGVPDPAIYELADIAGMYLIVSTDIYPATSKMNLFCSSWPVRNDINKWTDRIENTISSMIINGKNHCSAIAWNSGHNLTKWPQLDQILKKINKLDSARIMLIPSTLDQGNQHPSYYFTSTGLKAVVSNCKKLIADYKEINCPLFFDSNNDNTDADKKVDNLNSLISGNSDFFGLCLTTYSASTLPIISKESNKRESSLAESLSLRYFSVTAEPNNGNIIIKNSNSFAVFDNISIDWQSYNEQEWLAAGLINAGSLLPEEMRKIVIESKIHDETPPTHINIKVNWSDGSWLHQIRRRTSCLHLDWTSPHSSIVEPPAGRYTALNHGKLRLERDRHLLLISGSRFWFIFNKLTGTFESWRCGETEMLHSSGISTGAGPFWLITEASDQKTESLQYSNYVESIDFDCDGLSAVISASSIITVESALIFKANIRYEISHRGDLRIAASFEACLTKSTIRNISCQLVINTNRHLNRLQWYGFGPSASAVPNISASYNFPTKPDYSNWLMLHSEEASEQEQAWYGAHWLFCGNDNGLGLLLTANSRFSFASSLSLAERDDTDSIKFFSSNYHQLRLEFAENLFAQNALNVNPNTLSDNNDSEKKDQSITVFKRQYILQPSAINFL